MDSKKKIDSNNSKRKRVALASTIDDEPVCFDDKQFECPICFEILEDPHVTKCGHTFCYRCILLSMETSTLCPKCRKSVEQIFPNYLICELVMKRRKKNAQDAELGVGNGNLGKLRGLLDEHSEKLDVCELNVLIETLAHKKRRFEDASVLMQSALLKEFLSKVHQHKRDQLQHLAKEIMLIENDNRKAEQTLATKQDLKSISLQKNESHGCLISMPKDLNDDFNGNDHNLTSDNSIEKKIEILENKLSRSDGSSAIPSTSTPSTSAGAFTQFEIECFHSVDFVNKRKKMLSNFEDLEQLYFSTRLRESQLPTTNESDFYETLDEFKETLNKFTMYSRLRPIASLSYTSDPFNGSSVVSSIEFDRDNELFAVAGVTKKIKLFDYRTVISDRIGVMHYPVNELFCNSKISCISWSSYYKSMLASSDYEGTVTIWDPFCNQRVKQFEEHEKRCWSVDFNKVDTKLLGSGSDDWKVKLWSVDMPHSITSLEANANVCCVKFSPTSRYHIAFGSADHYVHYYDLRNSKTPLMVFKGHKKAVSYVSFLNSNEIVSASTDSQLRLWNINKSTCQRTFKGHANEKNFVGLASDGQFLACGSENNSLYVYHKGFSKPTLSYSFDGREKDRERREDDTSDFLSAVCWKPKSNVVVAANSQGTIKVLELV